MAKRNKRKSAAVSDRQAAGVPRCRTGIKGLDEVTNGGLPLGRPTLVCGAAGCGKTLLATEFLVRGAMDMGEPGVFMTFEEKPEDLATNVMSLGFDLRKLISQKKLTIDHVRVERNEIEETGEYDLEGLFVRLGFAIERGNWQGSDIYPRIPDNRPFAKKGAGSEARRIL